MPPQPDKRGSGHYSKTKPNGNAEAEPDQEEHFPETPRLIRLHGSSCGAVHRTTQQSTKQTGGDRPADGHAPFLQDQAL
jgi:hypothetical protein